MTTSTSGKPLLLSHPPIPPRFSAGLCHLCRGSSRCATLLAQNACPRARRKVTLSSLVFSLMVFANLHLLHFTFSVAPWLTRVPIHPTPDSLCWLYSLTCQYFFLTVSFFYFCFAGARLVEAANINQSLTSLGRVFQGGKLAAAFICVLAGGRECVSE